MAIDAGSATGYLDLDITGFLSSLQTAQTQASKAEKGFNAVGTKIQSVGDTMSKVGGNMTKTFTLPLVTAVTAVVNQYAKLEQAVGGVETLFKESADEVIKNSETAYLRAGVSGVEYMEQVTSFSASLLQGLGGDTVEAARIADIAMVDMSDNANKFGTDISLLQNAYQGFAKSNFTMLDNLKLGYGGTAGEMARLINESGVLGEKMKVTAKNVKDVPFDKMISAINVTQQRMGIFGTTAKEATETISGSFGALKASVLDFAGGLGDTNADISKLTQNMVGTFRIFAGNVTRVLRTIWDNLPLDDTTKKIIGIVAVAGPILVVLGKVITVIGGIVKGIGLVTGAMTALSANPVMLAIIGGTLAAGAVFGIMSALTDITSGAKELRDTLNGIDLKISEESKAAIGKGIEQGIAIADKTFEIQLAIDAEIETITTKVHETFGQIVAGANSRFGEQEMQTLKTNVNTYVGAAIDQIVLTVGLRAGEVAAEMEKLGVDEETKQAAVNAVYAQGDTAIADLQAYEAAAIAILEAIAAGGGKATKAQEKEFLALIGNIKAIGEEWEGVDTDGMISQLEGAYDAITAIPKKKLSSKELKDLKSSVKTFVGGAIDEVKATVTTKKTEIESAMKDLGLSDEVIKNAVSGVTSKGDTMIADLKGYEEQAVLLLNEMGAAGEGVTQSQIDAFAALMEQIGAIKLEIGLMEADMDGKVEALRNKVSRGVATEEEIAIVVNYDLRMGELKTEKAQADYDADLELFGTALANSTEANKPEIEMQLDLRTEEYKQEVEATKAETAESLSALWNDLIANTESGQAAMNAAFSDANIFTGLTQFFDMPDDFANLSEETKAEVTELILAAVPHLTAEDINAPNAPIQQYALEAMSNINDGLTEGAKEIESNESLKNALNVMLQSGALDNVDLSTLPDTLKGALAAIDFTEGGGEIGEDVMSGLGLGITTGEGEAKTDIETAADNIIQAAKTKFGIASPSTIFDEIGQQNMAGLAQGHATGMETVKTDLETAAEEVWTNIETIFVTAVEAIVTAVDTALGELPTKLDVHTLTIETNFTAWGTNMSAKALLISNNVVLNINTPISSLPIKIKAHTDTVLNNMTAWGAQMGAKGTAAGKSLADNTVSATGTLSSRMYTVASQAMAGFERGIDDAMSRIIEKVRAAMDAIIAEMQKALQIASPSKRVANEVGIFLPAGLAMGFETAMPEALKDIQKSLDNGIDGITAPTIEVGEAASINSVSSFASNLKQQYTQIAIWFESIENRIIDSIRNMSETLGHFVRNSGAILDGGSLLLQIPSNGYWPQTNRDYPDRSGNNNDNQGSDVFNFYSPKPINEVEAARLFKQTKRDMAEGF